MNWEKLAEAAWRCGNLRSAANQRATWNGFSALIADNKMYWGIIGCHLWRKYREVEEIRVNLGVTREWTQNYRLKRFALWCSRRSQA